MDKTQRYIREFLRQESAGGILLAIAALAALLVSNTPLRIYYDMLLDTTIAVQIGTLLVSKPFLLWVNDGLMAVFFFLVGLELKREILDGELRSLKSVAFPAFGAIGGMVLPALIYLYFNSDNAVAAEGWAIPTATDIAFALGILTLLGDRVPISLKIFLTSVAIFDDLGAIIIIAAFYTSNISLSALSVVIVSAIILFVLNRKNVTEKSIYIVIGIIMWTAMLKSGVHATLTGVLLAFFIPMKDKNNPDCSPLHELENDLHTAVAFVILPIFAFCNAGLYLGTMSIASITHPISIGITLGLTIGKNLGVFLFCWVAVKMRIATLPDDVTWGQIYGIAFLCGVGFTMSLFIGSLAFENTGTNLLIDERLGIILGSLISGVSGYFILSKTLPLNRRRRAD